MTVLKTLLYFGIFDYPLTKEEIFEFSECKNHDILDEQIQDLLRDGVIRRNNEFYIIASSEEEITTRRIAGNQYATRVMPKALKRAKLIAKFPYVEGVSISGSLSKGYFDSESDVDFFLITKPNRLWLARTLLMLYKKIALLNSRKFFCINYLIGSDSLKIEERNKFTAMELVTLQPVFGTRVFAEFFASNQWAFELFPNVNPKLKYLNTDPIRKPLWSKILQRMGNTLAGEKVDNWLRNFTIRHWEKKFPFMIPADFRIALKSTKNISKHHPRNFQKKVIAKLNHRYEEMEKTYDLKLGREYA